MRTIKTRPLTATERKNLEEIGKLLAQGKRA